MGIDDGKVIERQLGRNLRFPWMVVVRCHHGYPVVVASAAVSVSGVFPTVFWLTCPVLVRAVGELESVRFQDAYSPTAQSEERLWRLWLTGVLGKKVRLGFEFSLGNVGGVRGGKVKCLHAELASFLATGCGEVGRVVWTRVRRYLYNCKGCLVEDTGR